MHRSIELLIRFLIYREKLSMKSSKKTEQNQYVKIDAYKIQERKGKTSGRQLVPL